MLMDLMAAQNCQDERRQEVIATVERGRLKRKVGADRSGNVCQMNQMSGNCAERAVMRDQDQGTGAPFVEARSRILVVDDHASSRRGLRALFATCPSTEVISEAADGQEAVSLVEALQPDVVLMDVRMPLLDGLRATRLIKDRWPGVKVILLTVHSTSRAEVVEAGADGYLLKGCPTEELLAAVRKPQMCNGRLQ